MQSQQRIEDKLQLILEKLIFSEEIRELYETLSYMYELLKLANEQLFLGNPQVSLLKLSEASQVYERVGNYKSLSTSLFNIANIHFWEGRYAEAISCYRLSV